ncbi:recombinase family protein [Vagococcus salmoninarum]|uniref:recombinase family protein n=1 Tax=Vagococcus salmoninarum TaxID=2739 RepID=UPI0018800CC5|nr:recombinase family protein [Vagococcus salmoninarum]MBE9388696.1 recombinase family protein [Vagococcus salmoninarum]
MKTLAYIRSNMPIATFDQVSQMMDYQVTEMYVEDKLVSESREFMKLIEHAAENDVIIVYSLISIWQIKGIYTYLQLLKQKNVRLIAINEEIDTDNYKDFYDQMLFFFDVSKRSRSATTRRALNARREKGQSLGRPKINETTINKIKDLREQRYSLREIAVKCDVSLGTVHKYLH